MKGPTKRTPTEAVQTAVATLAAGGMVVVVDDEDRENEGDLVLPHPHQPARAGSEDQLAASS